MRFHVEPWSPEYGAPTEPELDEPAATPDVDVEVPSRAWRPVRPAAGPASEVVFVDGVRRVDATVWIEEEGGVPALGFCATYAAGAVRCGERAEVVEAAVDRGLFTSAAGAGPVVTGAVRYDVRPTAGETSEKLWLGIQARMGALEGEVAARHAAGGLIVVDGPLSHRRHVPGAVGFVKRQHVQYLPEDVRPVLGDLGVGERTPLFLTTASWSGFSWYLRLAPSLSPIGALVRCEIVADIDVAAAARVADTVTATLPRFASKEHKDPRAPQNLYPIAGLERELRRRLGDERLLYRQLRAAARRGGGGGVSGDGSPARAG